MLKKLSILVWMVVVILPITIHADETQTLDLVNQANEMTLEQVVSDMNQPTGITLNGQGQVLIADTYNNRILRSTDRGLEVVAGTIGSKDLYGFPLGGLIDGPVSEAYFNRPRDLVVDADGIIYVADTDNHVIRMIADGLVTTIAGNGTQGGSDGSLGEARFSYPSGITMDAMGDMYVADTLNNAIRKVTPTGQVTTLELTSANPLMTDHLLNEPSDVFMDEDGVLYILDSGNQQVKKVIDQVVYVVSGLPLVEGSEAYQPQGFTDGTKDLASYNFPKSLTVYDGVIYVADTWNHAIRIIKQDGVTSTLVGRGLAGNTLGTISEASLNGPSGLVVNEGVLYIADRWNNDLKSIDLAYGNLIYDLVPSYVKLGTDFSRRDDGQINVAINKTLVTYDDVVPVIYEDHSYFPIRVICEQMGAVVDYEASTRTVILDYNGRHVTYPLDADYMLIRNNRSLIPIRKLASDLGFYVTWLDDSRTVVISPRFTAE